MPGRCASRAAGRPWRRRFCRCGPAAAGGRRVDLRPRRRSTASAVSGRSAPRSSREPRGHRPSRPSASRRVPCRWVQREERDEGPRRHRSRPVRPRPRRPQRHVRPRLGGARDHAPRLPATTRTTSKLGARGRTSAGGGLAVASATGSLVGAAATAAASGQRLVHRSRAGSAAGGAGSGCWVEAASVPAVSGVAAAGAAGAAAASGAGGLRRRSRRATGGSDARHTTAPTAAVAAAPPPSTRAAQPGAHVLPRRHADVPCRCPAGPVSARACPWHRNPDIKPQRNKISGSPRP